MATTIFNALLPIVLTLLLEVSLPTMGAFIFLLERPTGRARGQPDGANYL